MSRRKQTSRRKHASPISPLRHGFRARSLLYCPAPQQPRAAPGRRSVRRGFDTTASTPGLPRTRGGAGAGRRPPPSGNKCRTGNRRRVGNKRHTGNKCRAGNKRLAGNARRRSRRSGRKGRPGRRSVKRGVTPQRQPRDFHGRGGGAGAGATMPSSLRQIAARGFLLPRPRDASILFAESPRAVFPLKASARMNGSVVSPFPGATILQCGPPKKD